MQPGFVVVILAGKTKIHGQDAIWVGYRFSEGFGFCLPGTLTLGVSGELGGAEVTGLEDVKLPGGAADFGLPEGGAARGR